MESQINNSAKNNTIIGFKEFIKNVYCLQEHRDKKSIFKINNDSGESNVFVEIASKRRVLCLYCSLNDWYIVGLSEGLTVRCIFSPHLSFSLNEINSFTCSVHGDG